MCEKGYALYHSKCERCRWSAAPQWNAALVPFWIFAAIAGSVVGAVTYIVSRRQLIKQKVRECAHATPQFRLDLFVAT